MEKVTGVYLYLPVAGSRPAFFHRYFFAPSLVRSFKSAFFSKRKGGRVGSVGGGGGGGGGDVVC